MGSEQGWGVEAVVHFWLYLIYVNVHGAWAGDMA